MNPNLLDYNYRPVNSQAIPILPPSSSISTLSPSAATRLNQTHCLQSSDCSINSGMINEMQTSQSYLHFDDTLLNLFINDSDSCATMPPNQMAPNDLISDQSQQQLVGTTNDHPYSRVERESRTDHQLTPISNSVNYGGNSPNLQLGRINSNSIGGNSQHHQTHHSHQPHHHHPPHPHQHQHPTHLQPFLQSHQRHQHSMSHHLLQPQPQPPPHQPPPSPHQSIHNYVQQSNSNHQIFNSNYLTRPQNIINHDSPEQCRGLSSPASSPSNIIRNMPQDNSPRTLTPSSGAPSLVGATNSYHTSSQSTQSSLSTQSSQKSEDLSQKASQIMNCDDLDRNRFKDKTQPSVQIARKPINPAPAPASPLPPPITLQPPKPKPEVIDVSFAQPREENNEEKVQLNSVPSSDRTVKEIEIRTVQTLHTVRQVFYQGRVLCETPAVKSQPVITPIGSLKLDAAHLENKTTLLAYLKQFSPFSFNQNNVDHCNANSTTMEVTPSSSNSSDLFSEGLTLKPDLESTSKSSSSSTNGNAEPQNNSGFSKPLPNTTRKSNKSVSSKESNLSSGNVAQESRNSTEPKSLPSSMFESNSKNQSNKRQLNYVSGSAKRTRKNGRAEIEETIKKETKEEEVKMKDKEDTIKKEELIDSEETRRETATALLSLHGNSSLMRVGEVTPDMVIDKIREPEFRPIEKDNQVFAKWAQDKNFYPGKTTSPQTDSKWLITFDDGEKRSVHESEIISVPYLVPGQHVMITYSNDSCAQRVIKRCFVKNGYDVEYEIENDDADGKRYPTRNIFLTSEMAAILLGKQSKFPSNASKFADVDLNNIIPKRSRISKTTSTTSSSATSTATTTTSNTASSTSLVQTAPSSVASHTCSSDDHGSVGDSDTGSVNSSKSTKGRSNSFSKKFLPSFSPSGKVTNENAKSKKNSASKYQPPLPFTYKKTSSDSSSSKSSSTSSTSSNSKLSIVQGEKEKLLGPIPPEGSTFFDGIGFLLADRTSNSNKEMSSSEAGCSIPFDADYLVSQIQNGSGRVFNDLESARNCTEINEIVLIACTYLKTSLYMQCLHAGISCVRHTWVIECCRERQLLQKTKFLLPSGFSIIKSSLPSDKNVFKKSANLFKGLKILIADTKLIDTWKPVLSAGQAIIVSGLPPSGGSSTRKASNSVDMIVADTNCSTSVIKKAQQTNIPIVTSEYLAQCLINGKKLQHDSHEEFTYK